MLANLHCSIQSLIGQLLLRSENEIGWLALALMTVVYLCPAFKSHLPHSDKGLHQNPRLQNLAIGPTFLCSILYDCSTTSASSISQKRMPLHFRGQLELSLTITDITLSGDERRTPRTSFNMGGSSMAEVHNFLRRTL